MGCVAPVYCPREAAHTVLHQVVAEHLEAVLGAVAEAGDGAGLPQFVEREFRAFLRCGRFEAGVGRFQCEGCARASTWCRVRVQGGGECPSCGGRGMTERAAHLVDAVLPWVPARQWVLMVPYRLRYQMAWNHGLSRAVLGVYTRALGDDYARGARARHCRWADGHGHGAAARGWGVEHECPFSHPRAGRVKVALTRATRRRRPAVPGVVPMADASLRRRDRART